MSTFDRLDEALDSLAALLRKIDWIQDVGVGPPDKPEAAMMAWLTMGEPEFADSRRPPVLAVEVNVIVWFGYLVDRVEAEAERKVGRGLMELTRLLQRNREGAVDEIGLNLDGNVVTVSLPRSAAGGPDYAMFAGQEFRVYPIGVLLTFEE